MPTLATGPIAEEDLYHGILWGLVTAIRGGQTATVDMYYGRPSLPDFGCEPALRAYADAGMRTAFGLVSRDQNIYAHESDEMFLSRLPAGLAEEVRRSPMGYAWPVDEVMASFERLSGAWHGHGGTDGEPDQFELWQRDGGKQLVSVGDGHQHGWFDRDDFCGCDQRYGVQPDWNHGSGHADGRSECKLYGQVHARVRGSGAFVRVTIRRRQPGAPSDRTVGSEAARAALRTAPRGPG